MAVTMTALSGQLIPLALYPAALQKIINYLPFKYISYPPLILLGKLTDAQIYWGLLSLAAWSIGLNLFNRLVFRVSLKKMVVFGG
jgi:ABC-2 type transport system permease protein